MANKDESKQLIYYAYGRGWKSKEWIMTLEQIRSLPEVPVNSR